MKHSFSASGHTRLFQSVLSIMLVLLLCTSMLPIDVLAATSTPEDTSTENVEEIENTGDGDSLQLGTDNSGGDSTVIRDPLDGNTGEDDLTFDPSQVEEPVINIPILPAIDDDLGPDIGTVNPGSGVTSKDPSVTDAEFQHVVVETVWDDNDNERNLRPDKVDVNLIAEGMMYGNTITLSADNDWCYLWQDLPKNHLFSPELVKFNIPGYRTTISSEFMEQDGIEFVMFTLTHTLKDEPAYVTMTAYISFEGDEDDTSGRPKNIRTKLLRDNMYFTELYYEDNATDIMLSSANRWRYVWKGLDSSFDWSLNFDVTQIPGYVCYQNYTVVDNMDTDTRYITYEYVYRHLEDVDETVDAYVYVSFENETAEKEQQRFPLKFTYSTGSGVSPTCIVSEDTEWSGHMVLPWDCASTGLFLSISGGYTHRNSYKVYSSVNTDPSSGKLTFVVYCLVGSVPWPSHISTDATVTLHGVTSGEYKTYPFTVRSLPPISPGSEGLDYLSKKIKLDTDNNYSGTATNIYPDGQCYLMFPSNFYSYYRCYTEVNTTFDADGNKHWYFDVYATPRTEKSECLYVFTTITWDDDNNSRGLRPDSLTLFMSCGYSGILYKPLKVPQQESVITYTTDPHPYVTDPYTFKYNLSNVPDSYRCESFCEEQYVEHEGELVRALILNFTCTYQGLPGTYSVRFRVDKPKDSLTTSYAFPSNIFVPVYQSSGSGYWFVKETMQFTSFTGFRDTFECTSNQQYVFCPPEVKGYTLQRSIEADGTRVFTYKPKEHNILTASVVFDESVPADFQCYLPLVVRCQHDKWGIGDYYDAIHMSGQRGDYTVTWKDIDLTRNYCIDFQESIDRRYAVSRSTSTQLLEDGTVSVHYTFNITWKDDNFGYRDTKIIIKADWNEIPPALVPSELKVRLFNNMQTSWEFTLSAANSWMTTLSELYEIPENDLDLKEFSIPGYTYYVTHDVYTENKHTTVYVYTLHWANTIPTYAVNLTAKVSWDDNESVSTRPEKQKLRLYRDGTLYKEVEVSAETNWEYRWEYLNGKYNWTVMWNSEYTQGYVVTNDSEFIKVNENTLEARYTQKLSRSAYPIKTNLTAHIVFEDTPENKIPDEVKFKFLYMGSEVENRTTGSTEFSLLKGNNFITTSTWHPGFGNYNIEFAEPLVGFDCVVDVQEEIVEKEEILFREISYTIVAKPNGSAAKIKYFQLYLTPKWEETGGWNQPDTLMLDVLCDGLLYSTVILRNSDKGETEKVSVKGPTNAVWDIVDHQGFGDYTAKITKTSETSSEARYDIAYDTTSRIPDITDLIVVATWADRDTPERPAHVDVQLYCEDEPIYEPVRLDNFNFWQYEFKSLDAHKSYHAEYVTDLGPNYKTTPATHKYALDAGAGYKGYTVLSLANRHSNTSNNSNTTSVGVKEVWFGDVSDQPSDVSVTVPGPDKNVMIDKLGQEGMWSNVWYDIGVNYANVQEAPKRNYQSRMRNNDGQYIVANIFDERAQEAWDLPETGGFGTQKLELIGSVMAMATALRLFTANKKRELEE